MYLQKHVGRWNRGAAAVNNTVNDVTFEDFLRFVVSWNIAL